MSQPIIWKGSVLLQEPPPSPHWNFSREKGAVYERTLCGPYALCMLARPLLNSFGVGTLAGLKIVEVDVKHEKLDKGTLYYRMEGALTPNGQLPELPPDKCNIQPAQQEFPLQRHPRYAGQPDNILNAIDSFIRSTSDDDREQFYNTVYFGGDVYSLELLQKLKTGFTHFVLFLPVYTWVTSSLILPVLSMGGFPEIPYGPITPPVITSMAPHAGGWLRKADEVQWTGAYWEVTRSWQAGIDIDPDIYPVRPA